MGLVRISVFLFPVRRFGLQVRAPGPDTGVLSDLGRGDSRRLVGLCDEGIRRGADHVAHHIENVGNTLAVHMLFGGLAVLLIPFR
jgi:hypothetical protein